MSINPYQSPLEAMPDAADRPAFKLYTAGHVAWATFLGTPLGGAWLMSLNYWRLGERTLGNITIAAALP